MKVLILSITAGEGHNSTAKAIRECLIAHGAECCILDTYRYINRALANVVSKGYLIASKDAKLAWSGGYRLAEKRRHSADDPSFTRMMNRVFLMRKIRDYIETSSPDVIVYTHPFAGIILDLLKQKSKMNLKTVGVLTDFVFHPYWEECLHSNYIVTACEHLGYQARQKGFADEQIVPIGIPINVKFAHSIPKEEARTQLGLNPYKRTILLMGGSMGYGNMQQTVSALDRVEADFQIIAVCGNNTSARLHIERMRTRKKVLALGFVDYVDRLMDASDVIITKPGGLTTSESLAKNLPMVIVNPIPGQEMRNTEFLLNNGAAMATTKTLPLEEILYQLLQNPRRLECMRQNIALIRKPNSTEDLYQFLVRITQEHSTAEAPPLTEDAVPESIDAGGAQ